MYFSTADEMAFLDTAAVESGLDIRQMMELAGWHMLELFSTLGLGKARTVAACVGSGNKGGDGLAAARHLANHGRAVTIILAGPLSALKPDPAHHLHLLREMGMPVLQYEAREKDAVREALRGADVVIDALIGYRLAGAPHGAAAEIIRLMRESQFVISYDLPSGVDATTGECHDPYVSADATLTLALPKRAFLTSASAAHAGAIYLGDLGIPGALYDRVQKGSRPDFAGHLIAIDARRAAAAL